MAVDIAFTPAFGSGQVVTPTAASASISIDGNAQSVCLTNLGVNVCYVRTAATSATATTAGYPVPAGTQCVITKPDGHNVLSHISALGTTLHVMTGEGL